MANGQNHALVALFLKPFDRLLHGLAAAAKDALAVAVDVGRDDVAVDFGQGVLDHVIRGQYGGHHAVVVYLDLAHFAPTRRGRFQGVGKGHNAGSNQGGIFAQRVAHHHVGFKAVALQQAQNGDVEREHGRLGDGGLHQVELGLAHLGLIVGVYKKVVG